MQVMMNSNLAANLSLQYIHKNTLAYGGLLGKTPFFFEAGNNDEDDLFSISDGSADSFEKKEGANIAKPSFMRVIGEAFQQLTWPIRFMTTGVKPSPQD